MKDLKKKYEASFILLLETHASGDKARKQAARTGFSGSFILDSNGQAGGIWCLWDATNWQVDILETSEQMVHMHVTWCGHAKWLLTVVYASTRYVRRIQLWEDLRRLANSHYDPWMVTSDFNTIINDGERKGGATNYCNCGILGFREMVQDCELLDAGFQGCPFTWKKGDLRQRLDRCLINMQWRLKFLEAVVFHLPFFKSDHRAVLMQTKKREKSNRNRRPFRFFASWLTHENFPSFMARAWPRSAPWCGQLPYFQGNLKVWNKRVFGSIFDRKNGLIRRLEAVSEKLIANPTADLERAHKRLWQEYEHVLMQEEILWFQKSRSKWISFGDRNSRFFHGVTTVRRRKNSFDLIQDDNGNWVSDPIELESMVTNYFKTLFAEQGNREPTCIMAAFPPLHEEDRVDINKVVTRSEIFNVINHMGAFKAPGMDGFQAVFFQSQWPIIGDSLCNMVFDIFREPSKVRDINETLITLIPKVEQVRNIKHFRPISLCNVSYKVITKLLANRLRLIIGRLVNPCQSSFVPNRQSRDNIIVAQEIFHSMRRKKREEGVDGHKN